MEDKKFVAYVELETENGVLKGYLKQGQSPITQDSRLCLPFALVSKEFCDKFDYSAQVVKCLNDSLNKPNWGYFKSIRREIQEVENEL